MGDGKTGGEGTVVVWLGGDGAASFGGDPVAGFKGGTSVGRTGEGLRGSCGSVSDWIGAASGCEDINRGMPYKTPISVRTAPTPIPSMSRQSKVGETSGKKVFGLAIIV